MPELGSPQWKEVEKDAIQWPVCNQDDKIVQKICDGVLLQHPEGFLVGGKQQPGTSSHPHPSRLLAPDPLISRTLGWLGSSRRAGATCAPRPPSVFHKPACATHVRQPTLLRPATQQVRREVTLGLLAVDGEMRPALTL